MGKAPFGSWATASMGLLAITYGLDRALDNRRNRTAWAIAALGAPVAVAGLTQWTRALAREASH